MDLRKKDSSKREMLLSDFALPPWVDDDCDDDQSKGADEALQTPILSFDKGYSKKSKSPLELLGPDVSSLILLHLDVKEIATVSVACKSLYDAARHPDLWRVKFETRWNYGRGRGPFDWFSSFQQAYKNTHDLWINHWNCADPCDGLTPGQCCIETGIVDSQHQSKGHCCPLCRYRSKIKPFRDQGTVETCAEAIHAATNIRLLQFGRDLTPYSESMAEQAFSVASTLHRKLLTGQFRSESLFFLTDLLFFRVYEDPDEMFEVETQTAPDSTLVALHSWHLAHFTNPDFNRPLVWRLSIQRPDCFTVYPSEGLLQPGESQVVVFGVKPLGSLLAHATQQLDAHREGVDKFWADIYTEEAHLPLAPFLVEYHFGSAFPCLPAGDDPRASVFNAMNTPPSFSDLPNMHVSRGDSVAPWYQSAQPQQQRTMCLSAHVNANYSLNEFRRRTLVPFKILDPSCHVFCSPQLEATQPRIWNYLENLDMERLETIKARAFRTQQACDSCGRTWGARLEELGQAFCVARLHAEIERTSLRKQMESLHQSLGSLLVAAAAGVQTKRHIQLCVCIHQTLVDSRSIPWWTERQREILLQWEVLADFLTTSYDMIWDETEANVYAEAHVYADHEPWRHAGAYKHTVCTDSVLARNKDMVLSSKLVVWKREPRYLEAFAHLAHSPGQFCLGPQEDPNHLHPTQKHSRYGRRQCGCVSDVFMDNPMCGLQAALCVVSDPRSLCVHGVFDRLPFPGTLVRRPMATVLPPLQKLPPQFLVTVPKLVRAIQKVEYYRLQHSLDLEAILLVDSWCPQSLKFDAERCSSSMKNFIFDVPPPGMGRYALSCRSTDLSGDNAIQRIEFESDSSGVQSRDDIELTAMRSSPETRARAQIPIRPGPRLLNLLWILSAQLGWVVDDNQGVGSVFVDRRILIGAQYLSISLMAGPLFWTLVARYFLWIPAAPIDYRLQALPFRTENEMRFLTEHECGYVAMMLLASYLFLGRWIERWTSRDFFRAMLETTPRGNMSPRILLENYQRLWDELCPLFLQRLVFVPKWNRRSRKTLMKHIAFWRNHDTERRSTFQARTGRGLVIFETPGGTVRLSEESNAKKMIIGALVILLSFEASSPHFSLNVVTVFSCSISLGMSMSLQSMETGRAGVTVSSTGSVVKTLSLVTIVILSFLIGQLVGCSGGVLFLAEFVVTSISFVLGGAGTISASAIESWGTFFFLSVASFWGYLFGRVSIMEGIRRKKCGFSSTMLCISIFSLAVFWSVVVFAWEWDAPVSLVIVRPTKLR